MYIEECSIFLSHTRLDKEFCNKFDNAAASEGVKRFRSEFETLEVPAWKTIKREIELSSALFLLVGKELVRAQASSINKMRDSWKYTQNWIAYEVGLACEHGVDVWVWCEDVEINFPVPYLNNYVLKGFGAEDEKEHGIEGIGFLRYVLRKYKQGMNFPLGWWERGFRCPNQNCGAQFNLQSYGERGVTFYCPTCLEEISLLEDWLAYETMSESEKRRLVEKWGRFNSYIESKKL